MRERVQVKTMPCGAEIAVQRTQRCLKWHICPPERRYACEIGCNGNPDEHARPVRLIRDRLGECVGGVRGEE